MRLRAWMLYIRSYRCQRRRSLASPALVKSREHSQAGENSFVGGRPHQNPVSGATVAQIIGNPDLKAWISSQSYTIPLDYLQLELGRRERDCILALSFWFPGSVAHNRQY